MAPHSMDSILQPPQWPASFSNFVTWCLMWDPKNRPTSTQALDHEYFADAMDPLRPKSSTSRLLGRKQSDLSFKSSRETNESPALSSKSSWFRRSLIARDSAPAVPQHDPNAKAIHTSSNLESDTTASSKSRPIVNKRSTWANGAPPTIGAPMPILPSIRAISPLSNTVTAQASGRVQVGGNVRPAAMSNTGEEKAKKIGRQLSMNSHGNHYGDGQVERGLNGARSPLSPMSAQKESFLSHLRKRARRFSGRHGVTSPQADDLEANVASEPWSSRSSFVGDTSVPEVGSGNDFTELDRALQSVRYSLEHSTNEPRALPVIPAPASNLKRHHSLRQANAGREAETSTTGIVTPISSRTRRALQMTSHPVHRYETPEEEDELLDEVLTSAHAAASRLAQFSTKEEEKKKHRSVLRQKDDNQQSASKIQMPGDGSVSAAYPTPSPSAKRNGVLFGQEASTPSHPVAISSKRPDFDHADPQWPTPPYEENEWGAAAAASIFAAGLVYR
jgi:meiosis induction protein kinase IME2/SME1